MNSQLIAYKTYPATVSYKVVERIVRHVHGHPDDFVDGDVIVRIRRFASYQLMMLPVSALDPAEFEVHSPTADIYADRLRGGERAPPIVYDGEEMSIIDGLHRLNGAVRAGATSILAYVGFDAHRPPGIEGFGRDTPLDRTTEVSA